MSDREGRWQAFIDYSNSRSTRLKNQHWQIENAIDEEDIGTIEEAAFKMIRLRTLKGLPKIHHIMRELPKMCALKESRKQILSIANEVDSSLPLDEQFDAQGNALSLDDVDKKWAQRHQQKLIMLTKKALDFVESSKEKETPLMLLDAALKNSRTRTSLLRRYLTRNITKRVDSQLIFKKLRGISSTSFTITRKS